MTFDPARNILNCGFGVCQHQSRTSGRLEELDQLGREHNLEIPSRAAPSIPFRFLFQSYPEFQSDVGGAYTEARSRIQRPSPDAAFACIRPSTQLSRHSSETEAITSVCQDCSRLRTSCSVLLPSVLSGKQPLRKSHSRWRRKRFPDFSPLGMYRGTNPYRARSQHG